MEINDCQKLTIVRDFRGGNINFITSTNLIKNFILVCSY